MVVNLTMTEKISIPIQKDGPQQGIEYEIPKGYEPMREGKVRSKPILGGLHHHYYREAA